MRDLPPPIIDQPRLVSLERRFFYSTLTMVAWILWTYLWLPFVSLLAWLAGIGAFSVWMVEPRDEIRWQTFAVYGIVFGAIPLVLTAWSRYNYYRYGHLDRRQAPPVVSLEDMGQAFGATGRQVERLRTGRRLSVEWTDDGRVEKVDGLGGRAQPDAALAFPGSPHRGTGPEREGTSS